MKILDIEMLGRQLPQCVYAVLSNGQQQEGRLTLEFSGSYAAAEEWQRREEVTLRRGGDVLFHGQVTEIQPRGAGLDYSVRVVVSDLLWEMDRLTLGEQLTDLDAAQTATELGAGAAMLWQRSARAAMSSWGSLARSCRANAAGWSTGGTGITLAVADGLKGIGRVTKAGGAVSQGTAVRAMLQANPGTVRRVNYETGEVRVTDAFAGDAEEWDTAQRTILAVDLAPRFEDTPSAVSAVMTWQDGSAGGTRVLKSPANVVHVGGAGTRVFAVSAPDGAQAQKAAPYMQNVLDSYFAAASRVQNFGSLTVPQEELNGSMLGKRFRLVGPGAAAAWAEVDNIVSAESWDLLRGTVELTVGLEVAAPSFDTATVEPLHNGGSGGGGGGGGDVEPSVEPGTETETGTDDEPGNALVLTVTKLTYAGTRDRFWATLAWQSNRWAAHSVSVDGRAYENMGTGKAKERTFEFDYGAHSVSIHAVSGADSADVTVPIDLFEDIGTGTETGGEDEPPALVPISVQVVARQSPTADVYSAEITAASQIPNATFRITLEGVGTVQNARMVVYDLQYGRAYPYTAVAIDPKTGQEHAKTGVLLRLREDFEEQPDPDAPVDPDEPPTGDGDDCDCAEKWAELEEWKSGVTARLTALEQNQANILARLTALENKTGGDCNCAAELAGLISAAVNAALADVRVAVQVGGVLEHNEIGNLQFTTNGHY